MSLLTSCASLDTKNNSVEDMEEVVFDDKIKTNSEDEIIVDDNDTKEGTAVLTSASGARETTKTAADGSQINTMFDRYGNKTETRYFNYDARLKFILLRTSASGQKQVFVYGQNGEVKSLPENMQDNVLNAPAVELANAAGIFEERRARVVSVDNPQNNKNLTPLPGSAFPVRTPVAVPSETTRDLQTKPAAESPKSSNNDTTTQKKNAGTPPPNK